MKITNDGRVTVPRHVREQLGLVPGTDVEWEMRDGCALLRRADAPGGRALVAHLRGRATVKMTTDEIMALMRGDD